MSVELMTRVWRDAPVNGSDLLVLLALADYGNEDGGGIYPSISTIASKARLSDAQARRIVHKLIAKGLLELVESGGWDGKRNRPNEYKITMRGGGAHESTPPRADASTGTNADASTLLTPTRVLYSRRCKEGTNADESTGTNPHASTVLAPMLYDPSLELSDQPSQDPSVESSSSEDEDLDAIPAAWRDIFGAPLPEDIHKAVSAKLSDCSDDAIIHGFRMAAKHDRRKFSYIEACARNYVPPARPTGFVSSNSYHVELPGVHLLEPPEQEISPPALAPRLAHDDPWAVALTELGRTLPGSAPHWLDGSYLEHNGELAGVPFYRIVMVQPRADAEWMQRQVEPAVRRKLSSILGQRITIEFVTAEMELAP